MEIQALKKEIKSNIGKSDAAYRIGLAKQIILNKVAIEDIVEMLLEEPPVSTRFSWLLGDISMQAADKAPEILEACFKRLDHIHIKNFDRTLSKQALICGDHIPEQLEGTIVNKLFEWLSSPTTSVSTKNNSLFALENLCKKYPELKSEYLAVVADQMDKNTNDFKKRAGKVLGRLHKDS